MLSSYSVWFCFLKLFKYVSVMMTRTRNGVTRMTCKKVNKETKGFFHVQEEDITDIIIAHVTLLR